MIRAIPASATAIHRMMATPKYKHWLKTAAIARAEYSAMTGTLYRDGVERAVALSAAANRSRAAQVEAAIATLRRYEFRAEIDDDETLMGRH